MSEDKKPKFRVKTVKLTGCVLVKKKADQPQPSGIILVKPKPLPVMHRFLKLKGVEG